MSSKRVLALWNDEGQNPEDTSVLRKKSVELPTPLDKEGREIIQTLIDSFMERDDAVGLAAPQIGINKRVIVFRIKGSENGQKKIKDINEIEVLVNPRITQERGEKVSAAEGCLSCPDVQVEVSRFPEIKVRALDAKGGKVNKKYLDFIARVIQHEIDHLDGKLIVDYGDIYYPKSKQLFFEKLFSETR
ncbi:MAG TPA: peptide deformylase [Smithella sp.]|nr:peptide deformylase [Smithella sp.]MDM7986740.1 peptide deformylase [Smithella sp.]HNY50903.1 peptide deformylase [Smithella sp.]HOG90885.1 peptide deformylase [Smithella sp.]HOU50274.1 peptide deformylase [Smithella sp.]